MPAGNPQSEISDLRSPEAASPRPSSEGCSDWLGATRTGRGRSRFGLMRYRSATVADSHGLPCCCRVMSKERVTESRKLRMNSVPTVLCQVTNHAAGLHGCAQKKDMKRHSIPLRIGVRGSARSPRSVRHPNFACESAIASRCFVTERCDLFDGANAVIRSPAGSVTRVAFGWSDVMFRSVVSEVRETVLEMVPGTGLEPVLPFGNLILSQKRLPFRHPGGHVVDCAIARSRGASAKTGNGRGGCIREWDASVRGGQGGRPRVQRL